jgi:predicted dehydrogenase
VEIVTVFDRDLARAKEVARRFDIPLVARSRDDLLAARLDAVSIATSPWSHAEHARAALNVGAHVFCEKPMALNTSEARSMAEAAENAGRILTVSHNFNFARASVRARTFLGASPDVISITAVQLSSDRRRLPAWYQHLQGGLLFDEVPHLIYTLIDWCGPLEISDARATWRGENSPGVVDVLFAGRAPARATLIFGAPISEWHVTIVARSGVVDLDLFRDIAIRVGSDGKHLARDVAWTSTRAMFEHAIGFAASGARMVRGQLRWGHEELIRQFVLACRGLRPNPVPVADALAVVALSDQLLEKIGAPSPRPWSPNASQA